MNGWIDRWMHGLMDGSIDRWMDESYFGPVKKLICV